MENCKREENCLIDNVATDNNIRVSATEEKKFSTITINGLDNEDDEDNQETIYYIVSTDNDKFPIKKEEIKLSGLLKTAFEGIDNDNQIPVNVNSKILNFIMIYLKYHAEFPVPENNTITVGGYLKSNIFSDVVECKWDVDFIENIVMADPDIAKSNLFDLLNMANYMEINTLIYLSAAKVASMIKGESLDKIKKIVSLDYLYENNHTN